MLVDAIKKYDMDLVVCGHHQDFWSKLMSSARQLINTVHVDMLIVRCATKKTNNRLVLSGNTPADAGVFIFAFSSPCGRTSIHKCHSISVINQLFGEISI